MTSAEEAQLRETVTGQVVPLLDGAPPNLWPRLQRVHADASAAAADSAFSQLKVRGNLGTPSLMATCIRLPRRFHLASRMVCQELANSACIWTTLFVSQRSDPTL